MGRDIGPTRTLSQAATWVALALIVLGALLGWVGPVLGASLPGAGVLALPLPAHFDISAYLTAELTALAVIVAILIGVNVASLQIAGETLSLALVGSLLATLGWFLGSWIFVSLVSLGYFLWPPTHFAQLWQILIWFAAIILMMVSYLGRLPSRLSGAAIARWAAQTLGRTRLSGWEARDAHAVLQSGIAAAARRGELVTARDMAMLAGGFLARYQDQDSATDADTIRKRYRALKNLLSGSALNIGAGPNAIAYDLGYLTAGVLLQAIAAGHEFTDTSHDLFSGLFRAIGAESERLIPLWAGMRHALCRRSPHGEAPYVLQFWQRHPSWPADDPRRIERIAQGIALLHTHCRHTYRLVAQTPSLSDQVSAVGPADGWPAAPAHAELSPDARMLVKLFKDMAGALYPAVGNKAVRSLNLRYVDQVRKLLVSTHDQIMPIWSPTASSASQHTVEAEYQACYQRIAGAGGQPPPSAAPTPAPGAG